MTALTRIGTIALLALLGCAAEVGEACDSNSDCESGTSCVPPGSPMVCGICSNEPRTCETDPDCDTGSHCEEYDPICPLCTSAMRPTQCVVDCTAGSCADDERCDGVRCLPLQCATDDYDCPSNFRCSTDGGGDEHGCERLSCGRDRDCDHGACVSGACWDGEGTCMGPVP